MVDIFCHHHHQRSGTLCTDCQTLLDYACQRLDSCPFNEHKPACNKCRVHCYSSTMRQRVKQVMRYAGPRMITRYPLLALQHMIDLARPVPDLHKHKPGSND